MYTSSKQLFSLLENLLEWSRSQRGIIEFNPDFIKLADVIEQIKTFFKNNLNEKNLSLTLRLENEQLMVFADKQMLNVILRNLISNAIKFTNNNGNIQVKAFKNDDCVVIQVCDDGVGIEESMIKQLFKIDSTHTSLGTNQEKGTGLGLILTREFVVKHEGKIWAESTPGKGSTFSFTLPLREE
ncbi:MAG: HAMP domain-containing histidine kinase [Bacteroidales bacterium]|nr:HAMP domain-containing histidine kinase [Bacteroidales bacterium]